MMDDRNDGTREVDREWLNAVEHLCHAAAEVHSLFPRGGEAHGYPAWLPEFGDAVADLQTWADAEREASRIAEQRRRFDDRWALFMDVVTSAMCEGPSDRWDFESMAQDVLEALSDAGALDMGDSNG